MKNDKKEQKPKLKDKKRPLHLIAVASIPLVIFGAVLAFVGVYMESPQTITDDIIFYTGITSLTAGTLGCVGAHLVNCFTKADEASDEKQNHDEQEFEPFPEFEKDNNERNLP